VQAFSLSLVQKWCLMHFGLPFETTGKPNHLTGMISLSVFIALNALLGAIGFGFLGWFLLIFGMYCRFFCYFLSVRL
jgi:hypothetical protein